MAGLQGLGLALKILESLVPRLGSGSPAGKDVLKVISTLSKHMEPGMVSQAGNRNELQNQMQRMQQMRQQMARPQGPGPGAAAPPGGAAMPPGGGAPGGMPGAEAA
jgi:hypothetical protein